VGTIYRHLTGEERRLAHQLRDQGKTFREIGAALGCSRQGAYWAIKKPPLRASPMPTWTPPLGHLTLAEREDISVGVRSGDTLTAIAGRLGRSVSTVSREVSANGGRHDYRAWSAHDRASQQLKRPKPRKLDHQPLLDQVTLWLQEWWSPRTITGRLRLIYPDDPMMWVSHETIYLSLYVQGRGELRRELSRCLRTGRARRRSRGRQNPGGGIRDMVMISDRPAEVADRAVPGHWEGDLIIGKNGGSAVGTLVERSSRFVMLLHLPQGRDAERVNRAMREAIVTLPQQLVRSITWDQGKEMARHADFSVDTGVQIYFCDPHSPWQRGSNENTNGLLRQYMPKRSDLSVHNAADLERIALSLNNRPRETLGFMTPLEKLTEFIALTG
jgi:transposase, IS30 family